MRPKSDDGTRSYVQARDFHNRLRQAELARVHGDMDAFRDYVFRFLVDASEMPFLREESDFAMEEGLFTPEMAEAYNAAVAWGERLGYLLTSDLATRETV